MKEIGAITVLGALIGVAASGGLTGLITGALVGKVIEDSVN